MREACHTFADRSVDGQGSQNEGAIPTPRRPLHLKIGKRRTLYKTTMVTTNSDREVRHEFCSTKVWYDLEPE